MMVAGKLSEEEYQAIKQLAFERGSNLSTEMRIAAQQYLQNPHGPLSEEVIELSFSHGYYLRLQAHWNPGEMTRRERYFVKALLDLLDDFEHDEGKFLGPES